MEDLVTVKELEKEIQETEGVKVDIHLEMDHLVRSYNFKPLSREDTLEDLERRIDYCTDPFVYYIKL